MLARVAIAIVVEVGYAYITRGYLAYLPSGLASELAVTGVRLVTIPIHWALFKDVIRSRARGPVTAAEPGTRRWWLHPVFAGGVLVLMAASAITPDIPRGWPWAFVVLFSIDNVVVAVREELVYRGVLQTLLERRMRAGRAIALSNVLFLVYHVGAFDFTPPRMLTILLVGAALGMVYAGTGSLRAPIVLHFVYDTIIVFRPLMPGPQSLVLSALVEMGLQIVAVVLLALWLRRVRAARHV